MNPSQKARVRQITAEARAARPDIPLDDEAFGQFLEARAERLGPSSVTHAGDFALVFACANGDTRAVHAFEREYLSRIPDLLPPRYRDDASEVAQVLRCKLLVPDTKGHAKIADFAGTGDLSAWLRVASVRVALNLKRSKRREVDLDEDSRLADKAAGDLEIDHLKRRFRGEFKAAFIAAMAALEPRVRTLLRQHYLDGLTMESIARVNQVHRITVVRWMEQARIALSRETRRELTARLRVGREELESILRLIDSQVHVTLSEVLRA